MENNNKIEQINNILSIVKICYLLFAGLIIYKDLFVSTEVTSMQMTLIKTGMAGSIILLSVYIFWSIWENKSSKLNKTRWFQILENLGLIMLFSVAIYVTGAAQSENKFLLLLVIISSTIQMGLKAGMLIAVMSSAIVLAMDMLTYNYYNINPYFENDLVLTGIFIIIAWALGYFVKLVEQYIEQLEYGINIKTYQALHDSEERAKILVEELKESDRNKNEFISALSHELRNPLATISAGLQLLDITKDKHEIIRAKEIMKHQLNQLSTLVEELLDITRINSNKIVPKKERLELNRLALLAAQDYKPLFEDKGVNLEIQISPESLYVEADSVRLIQIIGNLLHNALKFTSEGGGTLLSVCEENNEAVICVKDSGIGIKPECLSQLFEPFMQVDNSLDRQYGGLGLGLSIVKGIAELHDGSVDVHSEGLGKGSSFFIRLPLLLKTEIRVEVESIKSETSCSLRILLIDDNGNFAKILCSILNLLGHEAITASDGMEALRKAKEFSPQVIFCDIGLPEMNGFEIAKRIRSEDPMKDIYLIALTGYAREQDIVLAKESGFNQFLSKPIDISTIENILNSAF